METATGWWTKEVECPYCGNVQGADGELGEIETCEICEKEFKLPEFRL